MFVEWWRKQKEAKEKLIEEQKAEALEESKKHHEECVAIIGIAANKMANKICPISSDKCSVECVHYFAGIAHQPDIYFDPFFGCNKKLRPWKPRPVLPRCKLWGEIKNKYKG